MDSDNCFSLYALRHKKLKKLLGITYFTLIDEIIFYLDIENDNIWFTNKYEIAKKVKETTEVLGMQTETRKFTEPVNRYNSDDLIIIEFKVKEYKII